MPSATTRKMSHFVDLFCRMGKAEFYCLESIFRFYGLTGLAYPFAFALATRVQKDRAVLKAPDLDNDSPCFQALAGSLL